MDLIHKKEDENNIAEFRTYMNNMVWHTAYIRHQLSCRAGRVSAGNFTGVYGLLSNSVYTSVYDGLWLERIIVNTFMPSKVKDFIDHEHS